MPLLNLQAAPQVATGGLLLQWLGSTVKRVLEMRLICSQQLLISGVCKTGLDGCYMCSDTATG